MTREAFTTEQEAFWAGTFGDDYRERNKGERIVVSNIILFGKILRSAPGITSLVELGCNIGLNLKALQAINPAFDLRGYEINPTTAEIARDLGIAEIVEGTVLDPLSDEKQFDVAFTKGVLIHIDPEERHRVYENLYRLSKRYIVLCEYYNPTPVSVPYRGHENRLFKRDFAGEMIDRYGLKLIDYGFTYHRDNHFPKDDSTWFLLEK